MKTILAAMYAQGAATVMTMPGNPPSNPKRIMLCQITLSNEETGSERANALPKVAEST